MTDSSLYTSPHFGKFDIFVLLSYIVFVLLVEQNFDRDVCVSVLCCTPDCFSIPLCFIQSPDTVKICYLSIFRQGGLFGGRAYLNLHV